MKFAIPLCLLAAGFAAGGQKPAFEVASIKATDPNPDNGAFVGMTADGARVKYTK